MVQTVKFHVSRASLLHGSDRSKHCCAWGNRLAFGNNNDHCKFEGVDLLDSCVGGAGRVSLCA